MAVQGAAFILALLALGTPIQRLGRHATPTGAALAALGCVALGAADGLPLLLLGSALLGLGLGTIEVQVLGRMAGLNAVAGPGRSLLVAVAAVRES